jgi:hypothetical protein
MRRASSSGVQRSLRTFGSSWLWFHYFNSIIIFIISSSVSLHETHVIISATNYCVSPEDIVLALKTLYETHVIIL